MTEDFIAQWNLKQEQGGKEGYIGAPNKWWAQQHVGQEGFPDFQYFTQAETHQRRCLLEEFTREEGQRGSHTLRGT